MWEMMSRDGAALESMPSPSQSQDHSFASNCTLLKLSTCHPPSATLGLAFYPLWGGFELFYAIPHLLYEAIYMSSLGLTLRPVISFPVKLHILSSLEDG